MISRASLKRVLMKGVVLLLSLGFPLAWGATDSTLAVGGMQLPTTSPNNVFILEQGTTQFSPPSGSLNKALTTTKRCPINFNPYFEIASSYTNTQSGDQQFLVSISTCADFITVNANNYTLNFRAIRYYNTMDIGGIQGLSWDFSGLAGYKWTVYCYPPGITPPAIGSGNTCW